MDIPKGSKRHPAYTDAEDLVEHLTDILGEAQQMLQDYITCSSPIPTRRFRALTSAWWACHRARNIIRDHLSQLPLPKPTTPPQERGQ